jgi:protein TonB
MEQKKQEKLLYANLDDLIFENRNKEYGAYFLRQIYHKHIIKAVITAFIFFILFVSSPLIYNYIIGKVGDINKVKVVEYTTLAEPPPIDKNTPPPPPVEPPPPLKSTVKFTPPVIKPDEEVTEEPPPAVEELKEVDPGTKTVEGDANGIDPGLLDGNGKEAIDEGPPPIFTIVDNMPVFPGGEQEMMNFLKKNMKYPSLARENEIQGKVYVTFLIDAEGKVKDAKIVRGLGGGLDEEALRVVRSMPTWKPGSQNGRQVRVQFTIPINFNLK